MWPPPYGWPAASSLDEIHDLLQGQPPPAPTMGYPPILQPPFGHLARMQTMRHPNPHHTGTHHFLGTLRPIAAHSQLGASTMFPTFPRPLMTATARQRRHHPRPSDLAFQPKPKLKPHPEPQLRLRHPPNVALNYFKNFMRTGTLGNHAEKNNSST